jgi:phospholipase C
MCQVPWPNAGTRLPSRKATAGKGFVISISRGGARRRVAADFRRSGGGAIKEELTIIAISAVFTTTSVADVYGFGPRVPLLIISPWVKPGYITHTTLEFSSVMKFVEERFDLPALTERDQGANDFIDSFDFAQTPPPPLVLNPTTCPSPPAHSKKTSRAAP